MPGDGGPLAGLRIIEFQSAGPGPLGCMLLGDMGADVITIARPGEPSGARRLDPTARNRRSIVLDLKKPGATEIALRLTDSADVLTEGLRPGVMERLGLGPDVIAARNPRLIYARMTGWGQDGPLAQVAGHDHNYIAIAGILSTIGSKGGPPVPPLNLLGDYGGGGMFLAFSILTALFERFRSGKGQVLDVAMVDGVSLLAAFIHGMQATGNWREERGSNLLDTGAPFARPYQTADGQYVAVCSMEPEFYLNVLRGLELVGQVDPASQYDPSTWAATIDVMAARFVSEPLDHWLHQFEGVDSCVTPVLSLAEAYVHPHALARGAFLANGEGGGKQPAPAPRFSRSVVGVPRPPRSAGEDSDGILAELGYGSDDVEGFHHEGVLG